MPHVLKIAVVDDDESFRVALVESLYSLGYGADGYACAEDYIRAAAGRSFHCVVADIHMPGMSGLDLMKRCSSSDLKTPMVLITAWTDANLQSMAQDAACLLRKPFAMSDLVKCIEEAAKG